MKFTVQPSEGTETTTSRPLTDNYFLRDELAERLRKADPLVLDFLVQFYVDPDTRTPIQGHLDSLADAPLVKVAQVRIPSCDLDDQGTPCSERSGGSAVVLPMACDGGPPPLGQRDACQACRL